jgi:hypothetical protein
MDIEGMELEGLAGAANSVAKHRPILLVESVKVDKEQLRAWLGRYDYTTFEVGMNLLALHSTDKCLAQVKASK